MSTMEPGERLARLEVSVDALGAKLDESHKDLRAVKAALVGDANKPGVVDRVRKVEDQQARWQWHLRFLWSATVGLITSIAGWFITSR